MSNLQMIEELCGIVALQSRIIKEQSFVLAQLDAEVCAAEIDEENTRAKALCCDAG